MEMNERSKECHGHADPAGRVPRRRTGHLGRILGIAVSGAAFLCGGASPRAEAATVPTTFSAVADANEAGARVDANPALYYWQAWALFPDLNETEKSAVNGLGAGLSAGARDALAEKFERSLTLMRRAARSGAACDWGAEIGDGPAMVAPHVAKIRTAARVALFSAEVRRQGGNSSGSVEDIVAAMAVGRATGADAWLGGVGVSALVERTALLFAGERLAVLSPADRRVLIAGLKRLPPGARVADAAETERRLVVEWGLSRLDEARRGTPEDRPARMDAARRALGTTMFSNDAEGDAEWKRITAATGGTWEGLRGAFQSLDAYYRDLVAIGRAGVGELDALQESLERRVREGGHALAPGILTSLVPYTATTRRRELENEARRALLVAAVDLLEQDGKGTPAHVDPLSGRPVVVERAEGGRWVLKSPLASGRLDATLTVGLLPASAPASGSASGTR